jgi:hypothetical protein
VPFTLREQLSPLTPQQPYTLYDRADYLIEQIDSPLVKLNAMFVRDGAGLMILQITHHHIHLLVQTRDLHVELSHLLIQSSDFSLMGILSRRNAIQHSTSFVSS